MSAEGDGPELGNGLPGSPGGTLLLTRADCERLLTWETGLEAVRAAFIATATGEARGFHTIREPLPGGHFGLRSAAWPARELVGLKASGFFLSNRERGLDSHQAVVVLLDPESGRVRALVDGNHVTWLRTALAGLAGTLALARSDACHVLVVGNGLQAEAQIRSHAWGLADRQPTFSIHAPRDGVDNAKASAFAARMADLSIPVEAAADLRAALVRADVVITATPSTTPLVPGAWVTPGTHVSAIGADAPGKQELDDDLTARCRLFADDRDQSTRFGEGRSLKAGDELPTLGEVLAGRAAGRRTQSEITVFDSTGLGLHDVVVADTACRLALEAGAGTWFSF